MNYSISQAAAMLDINASALRFYEKNGLLSQVLRSGGGTRYFSEEDLETVRLIEALKSAGYSLEQIKVFLDKKCSAEKKLAMLNERIEALEGSLASLHAERQRLVAQATTETSTAMPPAAETKKKPKIIIKTK